MGKLHINAIPAGELWYEHEDAENTIFDLRLKLDMPRYKDQIKDIMDAIQKWLDYDNNLFKRMDELGLNKIYA